MRIRVLLVSLLVAGYASASASAGSVSGVDVSTIPPEITHAERSTLRIYYSDDGWCSATRVAETLVLSAAHCFLGFNGEKEVAEIGPVFFEHDGRKEAARVVESGTYRLADDRVQDWILFEPVSGADALHGIAIAEFPDSAGMAALLRNLGEFAGDRRGEPLWAITYPQIPFRRTFPRPGFRDVGSVFFARGFLRSDLAYKLSVLFFLERNQSYDDQYSREVPDFDVDTDALWETLPTKEDNPGARGIHILYDLYSKDGDSVLYHSADIFRGSSGGGVFVERTGHYLGLICTQAAPVDTTNMFLPVQALFRVDRICEQSCVLSKLEKCRRLIGDRPPMPAPTRCRP